MAGSTNLSLTLFTEPNATALLVLVFGILATLSVVSTRLVNRLGLPIVLLFLVLGMVAGSEGIGGIPFEDYAFAVRLGTIALVLILFDGGLNTPLSSVRQVLVPASLLATVGVAITAGLVALFARLFGLSWTESMLLGAVVSSTDAAAVFAVLRGGQLNLKPRIGRLIEVESCVNDPMAVILTTAMIQVMTAEAPLGWRLLLDVPLQLVIGLVIGIGCGLLGREILRRTRLSATGLYPVLTLSAAFVSFGTATLVWGSGFLAVYVTAVLLGNAGLPHHSGVARVHDALAWLSQITMFLLLGLLVFPSQLVQAAPIGLGIGVLMAVVARPAAVFACLVPLGYSLRELVYVGWAGLRGAVPIILGTFPVLAGVEGAGRIFNIVFFIVVVSSIIPGATIRGLTRRLRMDAPEPPQPLAVLEINSAQPLNGEVVSFFVEPSLAVCGAPLSEIEFPEGSAVILVVRGAELIAARGNTVLQPGDHVYVFVRPEDRAFVQLLFGRPEGTL